MELYCLGGYNNIIKNIGEIIVMSRRRPNEKTDEEKWLNFPDLYDAIETNLSQSIVLTGADGNEVPMKKSNAVIIGLIFGIAGTFYIDKVLRADPDAKKNLSSEASAFMTRRPLPPDVVNAYHDVRNREHIYSYVTNKIILQMTDTEKLNKQLKNLINNTPTFPQKEILQKEEDMGKLLAECLKVATSHKVRVIGEKKYIDEEIEELSKNIDVEKRIRNGIINSTHAVSIILEGEGLKNWPFNLLNGNCEFHDFDSLLEYIMENSLLILRVCYLQDVLRVFVMPSEYRLRKITEKDYVDVIAFLGTHQKEFRAKRKWPKYNIACLASNGLKERKWIPYGYYINNELIGYIDYKYTIKRGVELGIELIDEAHRSQALATSLLYFVRLKFPTLCTYSGTYEENERMRSTFQNAGYVIDVNKGKNGIVKDRVDGMYPEDESLYTNSVYYMAKPILEQYYDVGIKSPSIVP